MNRRGFLSSIGMALGAAVLDPEKLLWVPGMKKLFMAPQCGWRPLERPETNLDQRSHDVLAKLMDLQRMYNYYLSTQAELMALTPRSLYVHAGDISQAVLLPANDITSAMSVMMNECLRITPKPMVVRRSELSLRDIRFIRGQQWPDDVFNERQRTGRPTLTVNWMPKIVTVIDDRLDRLVE